MMPVLESNGTEDTTPPTTANVDGTAPIEVNAPAEESEAKKKPKVRRRIAGRELSEEQVAKRNKLTGELNAAKDKVDEAIAAYNDAIEPLWQSVADALQELNGVLESARELRDEIISDVDEYTLEKSDRWRESDRGQAVEAYKSEWEAAEIEEIELDEPEKLDDISFDPDVLDNLLDAAE